MAIRRGAEAEPRALGKAGFAGLRVMPAVGSLGSREVEAKGFAIVDRSLKLTRARLQAPQLQLERGSVGFAELMASGVHLQIAHAMAFPPARRPAVGDAHFTRESGADRAEENEGRSDPAEHGFDHGYFRSKSGARMDGKREMHWL